MFDPNRNLIDTFMQQYRDEVLVLRNDWERGFTETIVDMVSRFDPDRLVQVISAKQLNTMRGIVDRKKKC